MSEITERTIDKLKYIDINNILNNALIEIFHSHAKNMDSPEMLKMMTQDLDVNIDSMFNGKTALSVSCENNNEENVKTLIELKADVNKQDKQGYTPIMICARYATKNINIMQMLIDVNCDLNIRDNDKLSVLQNVLCDPKKEIYHIVKYIINNSNVELLTQKNNTALTLIYNSYKESSRYAKLLLERKANINHVNIENDNALNMLCKNNMDGIHDKTIKLLLENNIDSNQISNNKTALDYLFECNPDSPMVEYMFSIGMTHQDEKVILKKHLNFALQNECMSCIKLKELDTD